MYSVLLKNLWVSTHLLFPNSSQARDIFSGIVSEIGLETFNSDSQIILVYQNLYQIYNRVITVRSISNFSEFEEQDLSLWKLILDKCKKDEVYVLLLILINNFTFDQVAQILQSDLSKVKYTFNQAFKKVKPFPALHHDKNKQLRLYEYDEKAVSYLFIIQNFIEVVLGLSTLQTEKKIKSIIKENSKLDKYYQSILTDVNLLRNLKISDKMNHQVEEIMSSKNQVKSTLNFEKLNINFIKISAGIVVFIISTVLVYTFYFKSLKLDLNSNSQSVQLAEVKISKNDPVESLEPIERQNSLTQNNEKELENSNLKVSVSSPVSVSKTNIANLQTQPVQNSVLKPELQQKNIDNQIQKKGLATVDSSESIKKQIEIREQNKQQKRAANGLFKGKVIVKDLNKATDQIRNKIIELGGKKAGEVELGWIKNTKTTYFHFVIPKMSTEQMKTFINQWGKLNISFDKHPRKIAEDQERYIIEVVNE